MKFRVTYQDRSTKVVESVNAITAFNEAGKGTDLLVLYVKPVDQDKPKEGK